MADYVWPPSLRMSSVSWRYLSNAGAQTSPLTGVTRTISRSGDRLACSIRVSGSSGAERAQLQALTAALAGQSHRIYLPDLANPRRGVFPSSELLTNPEFIEGTTGWSGDSRYSRAVVDGVYRATVNANTGAAAYPAFQNPTYVQYAPYAMRAFMRAGRGTWAPYVYTAGTNNVTVAGGTGYGVSGAVPLATTGTSSGVYDNSTTGLSQGDFLDLHYASLTRCAQVDNGPNLLLQSNSFSTAPWTLNNATSGANGTAGPDGTISSQALVENATNAAHNAQQTFTISSAAADVAISCDIKQGTRGWGYLQLFEATGSSIVTGYFNVATGVVGNVYAGANWSNGRLFIVDRGNGWYRCHMVARKTNAATSVTGYVGSATGDNAATYAGTAAATALVIWNASAALSSVPVRLTATTSVASAGAAQTGERLYIKGGPASTAKALQIADMAELVLPTYSHLVRLTASLDFDAAGLGFLIFKPGLPTSPSDSAPVIVQQPMGKFMLASNETEYETQPGRFSDFTFDFVQDLTP